MGKLDRFLPAPLATPSLPLVCLCFTFAFGALHAPGSSDLGQKEIETWTCLYPLLLYVPNITTIMTRDAETSRQLCISFTGPKPDPPCVIRFAVRNRVGFVRSRAIHEELGNTQHSDGVRELSLVIVCFLRRTSLSGVASQVQ